MRRAQLCVARDLASASWEGSARILDVASWRACKVCMHHSDRMRSVWLTWRPYEKASCSVCEMYALHELLALLSGKSPAFWVGRSRADIRAWFSANCVLVYVRAENASNTGLLEASVKMQKDDSNVTLDRMVNFEGNDCGCEFRSGQ